ncbi:hypothetical protein HYQ44_007116 [Verticillium longisporum]|nr:hypothetical protein HYQ44_007116 [Verticillium longisporum]
MESLLARNRWSKPSCAEIDNSSVPLSPSIESGKRGSKAFTMDLYSMQKAQRETGQPKLVSASIDALLHPFSSTTHTNRQINEMHATATIRRGRAPQLKAWPSEATLKRAAPLLFDCESSGLSLLNHPSSDTDEEESEEEKGGILLAGLPRHTANIKPGQPLFSNEFFEIRKSPLGGMGAFAVQDLSPGDMILTERAIVRSTDVDRDLIRNFTNLSPSDQGLVLDLAMHKPSRIAHDDSLHTRLKAIFTTNYFACTTKAPGHGLFLVALRFNHACRPRMNVNYGFDRERDALVFTVAGGRVQAGTELTINYGKDAASLRAVYGFECACGGECKISRQRQDAREWGIDLQ